MATIDTEVQSSGVRRVLWITLALNIAVSAGKVVVGHLEAALQAAHPEIVDVVVHLEPEGHEAKAAAPA